MNMRERASRAADGVCQLTGTGFVSEKGCVSVVKECCSPDLDIAHKIRQEIERSKTALIANLSSLR